MRRKENRNKQAKGLNDVSGTLTSLAERMRNLDKTLPDRVSDLTVKTTLSLVEDLAARETPVDTSKALSNWVVALGTAPRAYLEPYSPGKAGSTRGASAGEVLAQAQAALAGRKQGQVIYLSNNAPYIQRLNEGYSKQAPAGFVEAAVLVARKFIVTLQASLLKDL